MFLVLSLILFQLGLGLAAANDTCYNKDGIEINDVVPCDPTAAATQCCSWGWICLSNGLCSPGPEAVNHGNTDYYRPDGCTDPTWSSEECFSGCNKFDGNGLEACDIGEFCCYNYEGCNCTATSLFTLGTAQFLTTIPLSASTPTPSSTPASTTATTTTSTSVFTTASTSLPTATSPEHAGVPSATQATGSSLSNGAALGAGLGVGLGVPILALTIILIIVYRRYTRSSAYQVPEEEKYELEVPNVVHEADDTQYLSPSQKFAQNARIPHEMDAERQFTPGWGWHR